MSATFHTKVHVHTIKNEMENRTMAFANPENLTKDQLEGRLVEPDAGVPCGMKLLTDGAPLGRRHARLEIFEKRGPGNGGVITAQFSYSELVPVKDGDPLAQGDTPVGAGAGEVKRGVADPAAPWVAEIITKNGKKYASIVAI